MELSGAVGDGNAGAVIAPIFQPLQAFQDDWPCFLITQVSDYAAHESSE
jgi:hypothetical protein